MRVTKFMTILIEFNKNLKITSISMLKWPKTEKMGPLQRILNSMPTFGTVLI